MGKRKSDSIQPWQEINGLSFATASDLVECAALERKIAKALRGITWECTICIPSDAEAVDDFEREGSKIVRRSQANVIHAIRKLGLRFEADEAWVGDVQVTRPDGSMFFMSEEFALKQLWLEIDRRFSFRPAWTFFRTVLLDYVDRVAPSNRRARPSV